MFHFTVTSVQVSCPTKSVTYAAWNEKQVLTIDFPSDAFVTARIDVFSSH